MSGLQSASPFDSPSIAARPQQVGLAMVVVEGAITIMYICYAVDPLLIQRWDNDFFNEMSEKLHQRLQHRSARAGEALSDGRFDGQIERTFGA